KYTKYGHYEILCPLVYVLKTFFTVIRKKSPPKHCVENFGTNLNQPAYALIRTLESRLDAALYRSAFFASIPFSAQAINHGKVLVNGVVVTSASYHVPRG
ncbi:unnamed protein product, partial [Discosporangium mesarthrocarpum]